MLVHMHVDAKGQPGCYSSEALHFHLFVAVSHWIWDSPDEADWSVSLKDHPAWVPCTEADTRHVPAPCPALAMAAGVPVQILMLTRQAISPAP